MEDPPRSRADTLIRDRREQSECANRIRPCSSASTPSANVRDPEQRARHLALGADGADAAVAATLDEAAARAQARGAPETAAELAEHAITLTPPDDREGAAVRGAKAAEYETLAGDDRRARALLEEAL